ncbi:MAG: hypothetical protein QM775_17135 [Pirellulales bacterium]
MPSFGELIATRFEKFGLLFEQADTNLTPTRFLSISGIIGVGGAIAHGHRRIESGNCAAGVCLAARSFPMIWLLLRRSRRLKQFAAQLPDALELLARALRCRSQPRGRIRLWSAQEMKPPISIEFGRVFEENNLGIPITDAMNNLTDRIPNLDLKFFATARSFCNVRRAVTWLKSSTRSVRSSATASASGDKSKPSPAKVGCRASYFWRCPVVLFGAVYRLNPEYVMVLFTDPLGKKMLAGAVVMQMLGAYMIRKIVNIKV